MWQKNTDIWYSTNGYIYSSTRKLLAESEHYKVFGDFEEALLVRKSDNYEICIGHFYGDPDGAIISPDEQFAVTFGCGIIVYFIREPFEDYMYDKKDKQWYESGRYEPIMWTDKAVLTNNMLDLYCGDEYNGSINIEELN